MRNFKKLSREELKNIVGGVKSCKLVFPDGNGGYITKTGSCDTMIVSGGGMTGAGPEYGLPVSQSFCNIGNGVAYTLSSNNGSSNC